MRSLQCCCDYPGCTMPGARRRQYTAYHNDEDNFATLCLEHQQEATEYWEELWAEYYAGRMC